MLLVEARLSVFLLFPSQQNMWAFFRGFHPHVTGGESPFKSEMAILC